MIKLNIILIIILSTNTHYAMITKIENMVIETNKMEEVIEQFILWINTCKKYAVKVFKEMQYNENVINIHAIHMEKLANIHKINITKLANIHEINMTKLANIEKVLENIEKQVTKFKKNDQDLLKVFNIKIESLYIAYRNQLIKPFYLLTRNNKNTQDDYWLTHITYELDYLFSYFAESTDSTQDSIREDMRIISSEVFKGFIIMRNNVIYNLADKCNVALQLPIIKNNTELVTIICRIKKSISRLNYTPPNTNFNLYRLDE